MLRSASRSAAQQGGPPAEPQPPERQKEALKVMGKLRATNHSGKRGAGCAHSTKDLEQDEEPSSAQQRAAKKKVRTSSKRYKGVQRGGTRNGDKRFIYDHPRKSRSGPLSCSRVPQAPLARPRYL